MALAFFEEKIRTWIADLKTSLTVVKTELNIVGRISKFGITRQ